ncbi:TPA: hypothetical protein ACYRK3_000093 [Stenotrophomonas maltophilia]|uniref:hypothetical protein n=1 Tax=Stenotrophomonas maltophilia TaxID=40324 RepID=UPI0025549AAA|nr:hypothetical protein [Stenotrophomonas maltophilia]EKX6273421.1 hypothetical protein [Stenotrophomonas maltophilia]
MDFFNARQSSWGKPAIRYNCTATVGTYGEKYFNCSVQEGANGGDVRCMNAAGDLNTQLFYWKQDCSTRTEETGWKPDKEFVCHNGCKYKGYKDPALGAFYSTMDTAANQILGVCRSTDFPPPETKPDPGGGTDPGGTDPGGGGTDPGGGGGTDPGGGGGTDPGGGGGTGPDPKPCPAGGKDADGKPCPGEGGGTDPGGGPNPGEGSGNGSGSGTCAKPPVCSGDAIQCAQLFQQWRAGCQAEGLGGKVTGDPTNCKAAYQCEGNAVACGQLAVMRKQMCGAGEGDGNGTLTGDGTCAQSFVCTGGDPVACAELKQVHMLRCAVEKLTKEGNGEDDYGETLNASDFIGISDGEGIEGLDAGGWLGGGSCPALNNTILSQMGVKGLDLLCQGAAVLAAYVLFLGWLHAAFILGRSLTGGG